MSLYDAMKDAVSLAQKADNIELYRQLLDLSAQALDLQAEVAQLKEENDELKKNRDISERIVRHRNPFITLEGDKLEIKYCAVCWDSDGKLIQMKPYIPYSTPELLCHKCKNKCVNKEN